jgi:uncharacterized membrane protein
MTGLTASLGMVLFLALVGWVILRLAIKRIRKIGANLQNRLTAPA